MLLYLLPIFLLISSISCDISCYDCSLAPDEYDYIITDKNIPPAIQNCSFTANQTRCHIDVTWYLTTSSTAINFLPEPDIKESLKSEHTLTANAFITGIGVIQQLQHLLSYSCSTDRCNDANKLKLLLESLTLRNQFTDLEDLLTPSSSFVGQWCKLDANRTDGGCISPTGIDPNTCTQCITSFTHESTTDKICASCSIDAPQEEFLKRETIFNIADRTRSESWSILCRSQHCNELSTGDRIRSKSDIEFDINKFLNITTTPSNKETIISPLLSISPLIILILIIKNLN